MDIIFSRTGGAYKYAVSDKGNNIIFAISYSISLLLWLNAKFKKIAVLYELQNDTVAVVEIDENEK